MTNTYLHNPRCSKSRQGIEILEKNGVKFTVVEYLKDLLDKSTLEKIYELLSKNYQIEEFTRTKEKTFTEIGKSIEQYQTKAKWVKLIQENPVLLERPILFSKTKAIIGRPPENLVK